MPGYTLCRIVRKTKRADHYVIKLIYNNTWLTVPSKHLTSIPSNFYSNPVWIFNRISSGIQYSVITLTILIALIAPLLNLLTYLELDRKVKVLYSRHRN